MTENNVMKSGSQYKYNEGCLFEAVRSVASQEDLISFMYPHKHGLSILAGVVVRMPCLDQFPVAASYLLKSGLGFQ